MSELKQPEKTWYCQIDNTTIGPIATTQLRKLAAAGTLQPTHKVRADGDQRWVAAGSIQGLFLPKESSGSRDTGSAATSEQNSKVTSAAGATANWMELARTKWRVLVALALMASLFMWGCSPRFEGKTAQSWINTLQSDSSVEERLDALNRLKSPKAVPVLVDMLGKKGGGHFATNRLMSLGPEASAAIPTLLAAIHTETKNGTILGSEAAMCLVTIAPEKLLQELDSADATTKRNILQGISVLASASVFLSAKKGSTSQFMTVGIESDGRIQEFRQSLAKRIPQLLIDTKDNDPKIRRAAINVLGDLGTLANESVPTLLEALGDADRLVQAAAFNSVTQILKESPRQNLLDDPRITKDLLAGSVKAAIDFLDQKFDKDDPRFNQDAAAKLLEMIGPPASDAIPILQRLAADQSNGMLRFRAEDAIKSIQRETPDEVAK